MALRAMNDNNINITANTDATHYYILGGRRASYVCQGIGEGLTVTADGLVTRLGTGQCSVYGRHIIVDNSASITTLTLPQNSSGYLVIEYDLTQALGNEASFKAVTVLNSDDLCNKGTKYDIPLYKFATTDSAVRLTDIRQFDYTKKPVAKLTAFTDSSVGSTVAQNDPFPWNAMENGNTKVFLTTHRYIQVLRSGTYDIEFYVEGYKTSPSTTTLGIFSGGGTTERPQFYGATTSCSFKCTKALNAGDTIYLYTPDPSGFTYSGNVTHWLKVSVSQDEFMVGNPYIEKSMVVSNVKKLYTNSFSIIYSKIFQNDDSRKFAYPYVYQLMNSAIKSTWQAKATFRVDSAEEALAGSMYAGAIDCKDGYMLVYFMAKPTTNPVIENLTYWEVE